MGTRDSDARLVVIRIWRESDGGIRLRIVDRADLPAGLRATVVASSVDVGLEALERILRAFADPHRDR